jgi:hypothetical protein
MPIQPSSIAETSRCFFKAQISSPWGARRGDERSHVMIVRLPSRIPQSLWKPVTHFSRLRKTCSVKTVFTRPIDWELTRQQHDQMIKFATALRLGTAETEAILKRFTRSSLEHATYLAFAELARPSKRSFCVGTCTRKCCDARSKSPEAQGLPPKTALSFIAICQSKKQARRKSAVRFATVAKGSTRLNWLSRGQSQSETRL